MELWYEDFGNSFNDTLVELQSFIGVDRMTLKPELVKQNTLTLADAISNYEEVKAGLSHTPYVRLTEQLLIPSRLAAI